MSTSLKLAHHNEDRRNYLSVFLVHVTYNIYGNIQYYCTVCMILPCALMLIAQNLHMYCMIGTTNSLLLCCYIVYCPVLNSTPQLKDLYTLLTPNYAAHWKVIGILLNIPKGRLDGIESSYPASSFRCCNKMLEMWLETNTSVTWKDVITAIDSPAISHDVSSVPVLHNPLSILSEDTAGMLNGQMYKLVEFIQGLM